MKKWSILLLSISLSTLALFTVPSLRQHSPSQSDARGGRSGAMEAMDFWSASRAYPEADIPADKYYRAFVEARSKFTDPSRGLRSSSVWEPMGPLNLQGRSKSVAINPLNPGTVYLGSASGGLWRTRTGVGGDWQQIRLGYPALGINAIAIDPADTSVMYIGTGEVYRYGIALGGLVIRTTRGSYGIGILKTSDAGVTWTKSLDWTYQQQRGVQRIAINPLNSRTVYAATTEGILKSTDAGGSWTNVLAVVMGEDLVIHSVDTNSILASCGNFESFGYGVYKTTDGGVNWVLLGGLPAFSGKTMLGAYRANNNIVYATVADSTTGEGSLWKSTNFGTSWTMCSSLTPSGILGVQGWYSHYPAVHPVNSSIVIVNSVGLSRSEDGGVSFTGSNGGYADNHSYAIHPTNPDIIYIVNDDGIYRSTDFGVTYDNIGFGLQTGQFYAGFSNSTSDSTIALVQSQDHIPGFRFLGSPVWDAGSAVDEAGWTAIDPVDDVNMYAISRFGQSFYRSTDRGGSFSIVVNFGTTGAWNAPIVVSPSAPSVLYAAKQKIYKSTNAGVNWAATNSNVNVSVNPAIAMAVSSSSPDTVYVGMAPQFLAAQIFRTTNGGVNWVNVTGSLPNRYPLDLAVDPGDARIVYATFGGFGSGHLFKSVDAGATWTDISGSLPDVPTGAVAIDPFNTNIVYAGNDIGVYVTTNGGGNWLGFSEGLPDAVITSDLTVSPSNRALRIGTHGNGAYERQLFNGSSPPAFDYRPLTFLNPLNGSEVLVGRTVPGCSVSIRNSGAQAQTDSFDVRFRVLDGATELFSGTKREAGLGMSEIRTILFPGTLDFPGTGAYALEAAVLVADANPGNDTLRGSVSVIDPPITHTVAVREHHVYAEISGGSAGPAGDDVQSRIALPFAFTFDGNLYDSLQISTNGWIEFGTGGAGTPAGLSTPEQLGAVGANENGRLGSASRPNKAIGVWWEDLNTDPPGSSITYSTLFTAPSRMFVVQWKNVRAYYDAGVTTYLNFQVRLFESSGRIELVYGSITPGTFFGSDAGAMIGMKDITGGSYHYYDLASGGTGTEAEVRTDLSPLTDWPGPDTAIGIGSGAVVSVDLSAQWNMVSVPVLRQDYSVQSIYPQLQADNIHAYTGAGYVLEDSLIPGKAYWGKSSAAAVQMVAGDPLGSISIPLTMGWNMIGSVDHEVAPPSDAPVSSLVFGYDDGYRIASTIQPGKGYWVKAATGGVIQLGSVARREDRHAIPSHATEVTIADRTGRSSILYLVDGGVENVDVARFELPPVPPGGVFDVRFRDHRMLQTYSPGSERAAIFDLRISSPEYPLTIVAKNIPECRGLVVAGRGEGEEDARFVLTGVSGGTLTIPAHRELALSMERMDGIPSTYALEQNYPNPFNPVTVIRYGLPVQSHVMITVYNRLGQVVGTPVNGIEPAGQRSITFNADGLASGVYFYRLSVRDGSDATHAATFVRKMVLIK